MTSFDWPSGGESEGHKSSAEWALILYWYLDELAGPAWQEILIWRQG